jgi:hypothetical protein
MARTLVRIGGPDLANAHLLVTGGRDGHVQRRGIRRRRGLYGLIVRWGGVGSERSERMRSRKHELEGRRWERVAVLLLLS